MNTERLTLRSLNEADAETVYALTSKEEVARFMRFPRHTDRSQARELIGELTAPNNLAWLIFERESGAAVGVFACRSGGEDAGETLREGGLSTFTAPEFWNRGYSSELLSAMLPVLKEAGICVLTAHVVADNLGSRRVLEKNGFSEWKVLHFSELPQGLVVYRREL